MACTHADKNHDYSGDSDPLSNLRQCEAYGIDPIDGLITRLTDKDSRWRNFWLKAKADKAVLKVKDRCHPHRSGKSTRS